MSSIPASARPYRWAAIVFLIATLAILALEVWGIRSTIALLHLR